MSSQRGRIGRFAWTSLGRFARDLLRRRSPSLAISLLLHVLGLLGLAGIGFTGGVQSGRLVLTAPSVQEADELPWEETVFEAAPLELAAEPSRPVELPRLAQAELPAAEPEALALEPAAVGTEVQLSPAMEDAGREILQLVSDDAALGSATQDAAAQDAAAQRTGGRAAESGAAFFGVRATGRSFVFVVDSSRSMKGGRFLFACRELVRSIRNLKPNQSFYVMLFDKHPERMRLPPDPDPPARPVPATPEHIARFEQWLATVELEAGTDPREVLGWALDLRPDAAFVLSDGEFGDRAEQFLGEHNWRDDPIRGRVPRMVIHAVGFHQAAGGSSLQRIAARFGGSYRQVTVPRRR